MSPVSILLIGRSGKDVVEDGEDGDADEANSAGGLTSRSAVVKKTSDESAAETSPTGDDMGREETKSLSYKSFAIIQYHLLVLSCLRCLYGTMCCYYNLFGWQSSTVLFMFANCMSHYRVIKQMACNLDWHCRKVLRPRRLN